MAEEFVDPRTHPTPSDRPPARTTDNREALVALHPYELPETIVLPIDAGHAPYLAWLDESVTP